MQSLRGTNGCDVTSSRASSRARQNGHTGIGTARPGRRCCGMGAARLDMPSAVWSRPEQDRDNDFVKPSYVPKPFTTPIYQPERGDEAKPLYKPPPSEFRPSEKPERGNKELADPPKMPDRPRDPIPAGPAKEKPGKKGGAPEREAPPSESPSESPADSPST
uniref:Uncharacterized protein n=1 Tax=Chlamydomonas euryale TaxID=1486919 RepID=A0A7R9Z5H1_9CHLO